MGLECDQCLHSYPPWADHAVRKIKDPWGPR